MIFPGNTGEAKYRRRDRNAIRKALREQARDLERERGGGEEEKTKKKKRSKIVCINEFHAITHK